MLLAEVGVKELKANDDEALELGEAEMDPDPVSERPAPD
jgi:hypothetical protein